MKLNIIDCRRTIQIYKFDCFRNIDFWNGLQIESFFVFDNRIVSILLSTVNIVYIWFVELHICCWFWLMLGETLKFVVLLQIGW